MKAEEGRKVFDRAKLIVVASGQMAPTAVSGVRPLPCMPSCPMRQAAMAWGSP